MNNSFVYDEMVLKRVPQFMVLIIILLLGLPYLGLNLGMDFGFITDQINQGKVHLSEYEVRGYFRQTLLQWSGFSLAAVTVLLSFTQYRLSNDRIAFIIGLSVLFSGSLGAFNTLVVDGISMPYIEKSNLDALIWIFANSISGLILMIGLALLLYSKKEKKLSLSAFTVLSIFFVLIALVLVYCLVGVEKLPSVLYKNSYFSRPYELITLGVYALILIFFYPKTYRKYPSILSHCIFYMALTEITIALYMMLLSNTPYDSAYNIAYFLKIVSYLIPCTCLVINYVFSYSMVLDTQKSLRRKQNQLKYIASHDSLTNLFNRREFEELLDKSIANALRTNNTLALLLIDLDNFKITNDTFGHIHGDELLKQFSNRLSLLIRKGDLLSRVGGDEFTLIALNLKSLATAHQLADRILNQINNPYSINGKLITVTVSIGIAVFPDDGLTTDDLLRKADLAMYKSKNSGKNAYLFYTKQLSYARHRESEVEAHLRKALQKDEFSLHYQPKYNLRTQEIVGAEVLLRWHNETLGWVSPNEFIPIAESTGLIIELGYSVLHKTCKQVMHWNKQYGHILPYSVNISPIQLVNTQFLGAFKKILQEYQYPPHYLEIEITENLLMAENEEITKVLHDLFVLGVKLSLDDFGKGYSSLSRLNHLPIDILKIDKEFVSDIGNGKEKVVLIDTIIKLANEFGMIAVAEGIETVDQMEYLVSKGCYFGQGFLLSLPVRAEQFVKLAYGKMGS